MWQRGSLNVLNRPRVCFVLFACPRSLCRARSIARAPPLPPSVRPPPSLPPSVSPSLPPSRLLSLSLSLSVVRAGGLSPSLHVHHCSFCTCVIFLGVLCVCVLGIHICIHVRYTYLQLYLCSVCISISVLGMHIAIHVRYTYLQLCLCSACIPPSMYGIHVNTQSSVAEFGQNHPCIQSFHTTPPPLRA